MIYLVLVIVGLHIPLRSSDYPLPAAWQVLYAFEMEARSFATSMTRQLVSGSMADAEAALKALEKYRLFLGFLGCWVLQVPQMIHSA